MFETALNGGAAFFAFLAAIFWFISSAGKAPIADRTYGGFLGTPEQIIAAMNYSSRWNRWAAICAGISALFIAAAALQNICN